MAKNQTVKTDLPVADYIARIEPATRQQDAKWLVDCCERITGEKAGMWGPSIVGTGSYHYKYDSGREGDMCLIGFASRASTLVVYLTGIIPDQTELLQKLGPHKIGKSCLHIKKLEQVDLDVLEKLMIRSVQAIRRKYPT